VVGLLFLGLVVADDANLRLNVRTLDTGIADAHGFLIGLRREHDPREQRGPFSPGEGDEWMRIFGIHTGDLTSPP
jgi:hypothetical protein